MLKRRTLLGAAAAMGTIAACSDTTNDPSSEPGKPGKTSPPGEYRESPLLADRVSAGDLAPVAERLPKEPFIVEPGLLVDSEMLTTEIGKYGGQLELAQESPDGDPVIFLGNIEPMLWAPNGFDYAAGLSGNVVAGYEVNDDDTVFTFHLREGLRWSDGQPVTMDDVTFAYDDVLLNAEITPEFPLYLRPGLQIDAPPAELAVVDDLTFSLTFAESYGAFPAQIAIGGWRSYADLIKPRHYLEQFHKKYADPVELAALMEEESIAADAWYELFLAKQFSAWIWNMTTEQGLGHPTLTAWILTRADTGTFTYERNPYYFKVDAEGNQLPYIDALRSQVVQDKETLTSRALFGEFDYLGERASLRQMPLIAEKAETGEIKMHISRMHRLAIAFSFNYAHADPVWQQVVRDVRFRRAMSLALNREEIIDSFYLGEFASIPEQTNPGEFDAAEAERLLDEMGLDKRDPDGFRLGPDGKRFDIPLEVQDASEDHIPMSELVAEYWNGVGVHTTVKPVDGTLLSERNDSNQVKATALWVVPEMWVTAGWADYLPDWWAPAWRDWIRSGGEIGIKPIPEALKLFELHGQFMAARVGTPEFDAAIEAIFENHRENLWTINPVEEFYYPTFWTSRVKNVPDGVKDQVFGVLVNLAMEQWYIEE